MERVLALIASVAFPGTGFIYAGRPVWAYAGILLLMLLAVLMGRTGLIFSPSGLVISLALKALAVTGLIVVSVIFIFRQRYNHSISVLSRAGHYLIFIAAFIIFFHTAVEGWFNRHIGGFGFYQSAANMMPTIDRGDVVLVDSRDGAVSSVGKGDVVAFSPPEMYGESAVWVSRIAAVAGDEISVDETGFLINQQRVDNGGLTQILSGDIEPGELEKNTVFVLGDHRDLSNDSRFWGALNTEKIIGRAVAVVLSETGGPVFRRLVKKPEDKTMNQ